MLKKDDIKPAKGVRDWYGREALLRNRVRDTLQEIFQRYGYVPLETPVIEREDILSFKGGGEIQKEIFKLSDQGKRSLALRFDHTLPLARFFTTHKELKKPFKRYVMGEVFRDGPTQPDQGRYRVFSQCDVDIIGVKGMAAEAELLTLASDAVTELGLGKVTIRINNRKVLDGIMDNADISETSKLQAILVLDKLDKIGVEGVEKEFSALGSTVISDSAIKKLIGNTLIEGDNKEKTDFLHGIISSEKGKEGLEEIGHLLDYCKEMNFDFVEFTPSLARGLDYYTGTTLEVFLENKEVIDSALLAGGRFDNLLGDFSGSDEPIYAIGISFGLERICTAIESSSLNGKETTTELFIIPMKTMAQSLKRAHMLRKEKINTDVELNGRSLKAAMRYANSSNIPFVGIIGEDEINNDVISIKRLSDGMQNKVKINDVKSYLKENR